MRAVGRGLRLAVVPAVLVCGSVVAGCGDDAADSGSGDESSAGSDLASLAVIDTQVDINDSEGSEGDPLAVGDTVSTNPDGFGEVDYFDGSITRVAEDAEFTLTGLSDEEGDRRVESSLDTGTSWNRVEKLSQTEGGYSIETPVATATATGTAFAVDCTDAPGSCVFTVVEGSVELELPDGTVIELTAPETLTVTADEPPPEPEALTAADLEDDTWITTNLALDEDAGLDPVTIDDTGTDEEGAGDSEPSANAQRVAAMIQTGLPLLTDEEAECTAQVMLDSLGDSLAEAFAGGPPDSALIPQQFATLQKSAVEAGTAPSVEENAAAVVACVPEPVSFSGSEPPAGSVECINSTLSGSTEYQTYLGDFRFVGTYYDQQAGVIDTRGGGVEQSEVTLSALTGACPG